jgi:RNA polymerase subunit RPABC4/transcription elongation factor Spt4
MKVTCPTCNRSDLDSTWKFYVPGHSSPADGKPCAGGDKGTKPNHSKCGRLQLCFKCGRYVSRSARFCRYCDE